MARAPVILEQTKKASSSLAVPLLKTDVNRMSSSFVITYFFT